PLTQEARIWAQVVSRTLAWTQPMRILWRSCVASSKMRSVLSNDRQLANLRQLKNKKQKPKYHKRSAEDGVLCRGSGWPRKILFSFCFLFFNCLKLSCCLSLEDGK